MKIEEMEGLRLGDSRKLIEFALRKAQQLDDELIAAGPPESARDHELTHLLEDTADLIRTLVKDYTEHTALQNHLKDLGREMDLHL